MAEWEHTDYTHSRSGVGLAQHQLGHSRWDQCSVVGIWIYENVCMREKFKHSVVVVFSSFFRRYNIFQKFLQV